MAQVRALEKACKAGMSVSVGEQIVRNVERGVSERAIAWIWRARQAGWSPDAACSQMHRQHYADKTRRPHEFGASALKHYFPVYLRTLRLKRGI